MGRIPTEKYYALTNVKEEAVTDHLCNVRN